MKKRFLVTKVVLAGILVVFVMGCTKSIEEKQVRAESSAGEEEISRLSASVVSVQQDTTSPSYPDLPDTEKTEEEELIQTANDALKNYFDASVEPSEYEISVYFCKDNHKHNYSVAFDVPQNKEIWELPESIGSDGFPTQEAVEKMKPEYYVTFSEEKEVNGVYVSFMKWEQLEVPLSLEETKKVAEEFLVSKHMIVDDKIVFCGISIISESKIALTYQNGDNGAIQLRVDTLAGKVEQFEYMSKEQALNILKPIEEGMGLG